jgi:hypothetical protein
MTSGTNSDKRSFEIASLLIAISALSYAAGYLVVESYHEGLNLHAPSGEYFRIEYLHIGVLCNLSIAIGTIPTFLFFAERPPPDEPSLKKYLKWMAFGYCLLLTLGMYLQVLFSPPHHQPLCAQIVLVAAIFIWLSNSFFQWSEQVVTCAMWVVFFLSLGFFIVEAATVCNKSLWWRWLTEPVSGDYYMARDFLSWFSFILFSVFLGRLSEFVYRGWFSDKKAERILTITVAPLPVFVYYILLVIFARSIFTHIPVAKGGGDFSDVGPSIVYARPGTILPPSVKDSQEVLVILHTSDCLFVTKFDNKTRKNIGKTSDVPQIDELMVNQLMAIGDVRQQ